MHPFTRFITAFSLFALSLSFPIWDTLKEPSPNSIELASETAGQNETSPQENSSSVSVPEENLQNFTESKPALTDIQGHWAQSAIDELYQKNLVDAYLDGSFHPDEVLTGGELIHMSLKAFGYSLNGDEITEAETLGWIQNPNEWAQDQPKIISRAEALKVILSAAALTPSTETSPNFPDVNAITDWFAPYSAYAFKHALLKGDSNGNFNGNAPLSRGEACVLISRILNQNSEVKNPSPTLP